MIGLEEKVAVAVPNTYQDWLDCFERIKESPLSGNKDFDLLSHGSFDGTGAMLTAFQQQMVDTINTVLNKSVRRFVRDLNECITFNELDHIDVLFKRLKKDINRTTFFLELSFLSSEFKSELYKSISDQMIKFWNDTIEYLQHEAFESFNSDLEDALFLIRRIRLF